MRQLLVDPAEASGIETLADGLEMSLSELVTLAIDHFYGKGRSPSRQRGLRRRRNDCAAGDRVLSPRWLLGQNFDGEGRRGRAVPVGSLGRE